MQRGKNPAASLTMTLYQHNITESKLSPPLACEQGDMGDRSNIFFYKIFFLLPRLR